MKMAAWTICVMFVIALTVNSGLAEFKFTAKSWGSPPLLQVHLLDTVEISCQTNEPNATVTLESNLGAGYKDAKTLWGSALRQKGQNFTLTVERALNQNMKCTATNHTSTPIDLILGILLIIPFPRKVTPELFPNKKVILVEQGGSINIICEAPGSGSVSNKYLSWNKVIGGKNVKIKDTDVDVKFTTKIGSIYEQAIFMIKNADKTMEGKYTCIRSVKGVITEVSTEIQLKANLPPVIKLDPPSGKIQVRERKMNVSAVCTVTGSPRPKKAWYFNGKVVRNCPLLSTPNCYLDIVTPIRRDSGIYTCKASNSVGNATATLSILVIVPVKLEKPEPRVYLGFNMPSSQYCILEHGNPLPKITWSYQPFPCGAVEDCEAREDAWQTISRHGTISPSNTVPTNTSILTIGKSELSSFYRCTADNTFDSDSRIFSVRRVENPPPEFDIHPQNPKLNENQTLYLVCSAQYNVFDKTQWLKDNKTLPAGVNRTYHVYKGKDILTFHPTSVNDTGNYTCIATKRRGGGQVKRYSYVDVRALVKPNIHNFRNQSFFEDNTTAAQILCNTTGNPPPTLSWSFNMKTIKAGPLIDTSRCKDSNSGFYFLQNDRSRHLIICKPSYEKHSGNYSCHAKSSLGKIEKTKDVTIFASPQIRDWIPTLKFTKGGSVRVTCSSRGYPTPTIKWLKVLSTDTEEVVVSKSYSNGTADIEFAKADVKIQGNYSCVSTNIYGLDRRFTTLVFADQRVASGSGKMSAATIAAIVVPIVLLMLICVLYMIWYRRRLQVIYAPGLEPGLNFGLDPNKSVLEQSGKLRYDPEFEFPREYLTLSKIIGSGAFGQVWLAEAIGISAFNPRDRSLQAMKQRKRLRSLKKKPLVVSFTRERTKSNLYIEEGKEKTEVAVKSLKDDASDDEKRDLASELKILIHLGHNKNLVNLLGACTKGDNILVILEFCPYGNLLKFLKARRDIFEPDWYKLKKNMGDELTYIDLMQTAHAVARGMEYLSLRKCIHRDLAARNILIGDQYTPKIADFGLARDIEKDDYYRKQTSGLLPIKWMAPESLFNSKYTDKTDVWSYGILLWEIFTLGGTPYPGISTAGLYEFLAEGNRMSQPDMCPDAVFQIMFDCWEEAPEDRPSFTLLLDRVEGVMHDYIKKDADIVTPEGYMAPQDEAELQKLRESKRKFAKDRKKSERPLPEAPNGTNTSETQPMVERDSQSSPNNLEDDKAKTSYVNQNPNTYFELRTEGSFSSNESRV